MTWLVYTWLLERWETFAENFQPLRGGSGGEEDGGEKECSLHSGRD